MTTELIYTEVLYQNCSAIIANNLLSILLQGCVPQFVSYFHHIHSVVAGVSIIIGGIPALIAVS